MKEITTPSTIMYHTYLADYAGCGYIRCIFPSMLLSQYIHSGKVAFIPSYNMHFINDKSYYDRHLFVMFQRSATPDQLKLIKHFKNVFRGPTKTPLIYEIDDLLTDIPKWNFAHPYYSRYSETAIEIMKNMDGIVVSTNRLRDIYSQYNKNIEVSENHLPKFMWGEPQFRGTKNQKPRILWAGSGNHFSQDKSVCGGDFDSELINFIKKTTDIYTWILIGGHPIELKNIDGVEIHGWQNIFEYPYYIKSLNADLAIAPLEDNTFNSCKSNIKALEYTAAGIPAIYSNVEPYKNMTAVVNSSEEMIQKIELLLGDKDSIGSLWYSDYTKLKSQLFWEENNNLSKYFGKLIKPFGLKLPK